MGKKDHFKRLLVPRTDLLFCLNRNIKQLKKFYLLLAQHLLYFPIACYIHIIAEFWGASTGKKQGFLPAFSKTYMLQ
jgi:hypothetical protein